MSTFIECRHLELVQGAPKVFESGKIRYLIFGVTDVVTVHLKEEMGCAAQMRSADQLTSVAAEGHQLQPKGTVHRRQYSRMGLPIAGGRCSCRHTSTYHHCAPAYHCSYIVH